MNSKKNGKQRRVGKLNAKVNRGSHQHRRATEGKSNIGVKRVTLLPGFLINGFSSGTAKKTEAHAIHKTEDHLLTENLQAFLERKGNLRRSERILKKHKINPSSLSRSPRSDTCEHQELPLINNESSIPHCKSVSIKSILKKNSKSIFKEISDKFSKVHIQTNPKESHQLQQTNQVINSNDDFINCAERHYNNYDQTNISPPNRQFITRLICNRSICDDFLRKIQVNFNRNAVEVCQENIKREINSANMILEGKGQRKETVSWDADDSDTDAKDCGAIVPIPEKNWVYHTPSNQKIVASQVEECHLKPGLMYMHNNRCSLYELNPKHANMDLNGDNPVKNTYSKQIGDVKKTTANFEIRTKTVKVHNEYQPAKDSPQWIWNDNQSRDVGMMIHNTHQVPFIPSCSTELKARMPVLTSYLEKKIPKTPIVPDTPNLNYHHSGREFTFIEDGNNFKIQVSQPMYGTKRSLSEEDEFVVKKRNNFREQGRCEKPKMFDFNSQERNNLFDFGIIM